MTGKLKEPESMDELVYFTNRTLEFEDSGVGKAKKRKKKVNCPKCKKGLMGKPVEKGKVKIRATEYECPECGHRIPKDEYEESLTACAKYVCPFCLKEEEQELPFKRKNINGVKTLRVICKSCDGKIDVTKKMKEPKKKKKKK